VQHVRYRVQFKATNGLTGGNAGQITLTAPAGTQFSAGKADYTVTDLSTGSTGQPATGSLNASANQVTVTNPVAIAPGDRVQVDARQTTNTTTTGSQALAIHTSADTTDGNATYSLAAPRAPSGVAVGLSSRAAGATHVPYLVRFTPSDLGGLAVNAGTIRVAAPAGTTLPSSGGRYQLTDLTTGRVRSPLPVTLSGGGTVVTVTTGFELPLGHRAPLVISDVTNARAVAQQLAVSTVRTRAP
jgi:hypothetical protein